MKTLIKSGLLLALTWVVCLSGCGYNPAYLEPQSHESDLKSALGQLEETERKMKISSNMTAQEYLDLGLLRARISEMYKRKLGRTTPESNRSKYYTLSDRIRELDAKAIYAFSEASRDDSEPKIAIRALMESARICRGRWPHQSIAWQTHLRQILHRFPDTEAPDLFPVSRTPRHYVYKNLAYYYSAKELRHQTVAAMAFAMLSLEEVRSDSGQAEKEYSASLDELVQTEPRIVCPEFQPLVIQAMRELFATPFNETEIQNRLRRAMEEFKNSAPSRITLTLEHVGLNGILVAYDAYFPEIPSKREAYKQMAKSRQWSAYPPSLPEYILRASVLSTDKLSLETALHTSRVFAPFTFTKPMQFDKTGRAKGRALLVWSEYALPRVDSLSFYLLMRPDTLMSRAFQPITTGRTYIQPLRVEPSKFAEK